MQTYSKTILNANLADILPELSPAAQREIACVLSKQADNNRNENELERIHIKEWLPYVSLPTLKAISKLINEEVGIPEEDLKGAASNG